MLDLCESIKHVTVNCIQISYLLLKLLSTCCESNLRLCSLFSGSRCALLSLYLCINSLQLQFVNGIERSYFLTNAMMSAKMTARYARKL